MLPSSSSHLARYGGFNHYKKFWLMQTQLEKQADQSSSSASSSSSLCLQGSCSPAAVKDSIKPHHIPSTVVTIGGEPHHVIALTHYGTCVRAGSSDMAAHASSGPHCVNLISHCSLVSEPGSVTTTNSFINIPRFNSHETAASMNIIAGPRLSLAFDCHNVSESIKTAKQEWSMSVVRSPVLHQGIDEGSAATDEYESSESSIEVENRSALRNGAAFQASSVSSSAALAERMTDRVVDAGDDGEYTNRPLALMVASPAVRSSPPVSGAHLRSCTLCGTSKTPLWRSGPNGPKSLCNACGIRIKKTKRLEEALHLGRSASLSSSTCKGALKRKLSSETPRNPSIQRKKRANQLCNRLQQVDSLPFKEVLEFSRHQQVHSCKPLDPCMKIFTPLLSENDRGAADDIFAKDVEEAAVLLMALSCGIVPS